MIISTTLLIAAVCMAFAVQQWWRGYHVVAIGFMTFAIVMAGISIEARKGNQKAEATEAGQQR